jgi:ankyrin repeat protein
VILGLLVVCIATSAQKLSAQAPAKVDFGRDVQPLFQTYCIGCHGPSQQMNGLRLDRRRDAMRGGTIAVIGPGNSAGSRLYLKLIGNQYGPQMPPTGPLSPGQISVIKGWIDQGAEWPDELSGEKLPSPTDPKAARLMETLRNGDRLRFKKMLKEDPRAASLKGAGGATPLMYAALYGDSDSVRLLLENGADPNVKNDAGATALMWAAHDLDKTRLLLERGADPNARSDDGRTPLITAAGQFGSGPIVKLLLDHGANPSVASLFFVGQVTPLGEAAYVGDESVMRMLIEHGADTKGSAFMGLYLATLAKCAGCVDILLGSADPVALNRAMLLLSPPMGDARGIALLLDHGASANAKPPGNLFEGRSVLMAAATSDALPVEVVRTLVNRGADVNAKSTKGETALDFAKQKGATAVVDLLIKAGAKEGDTSSDTPLKPAPEGSVRAALERSIPLLQRTDVAFMHKSGCVSCHNDSLTAMTIATARKHGLGIDEQTAHKQLSAIGSYVDSWRERVLQGMGIGGDSDSISYILLGMAAENYPPDPATDAFASYLKARQSPNGQWSIRAHRPPIESSDIEVTAASMRAIQVYAPKTQRAEYQKSVRLAASWLSKAAPETTEDRTFQLLGLIWAGANKEKIRIAARELLAKQKPDGGWAQLASLQSDAYATGQALVALNDSGALSISAPAYKHGIQFLLKTQIEDGSWHVRSRVVPIQPFFESDFPHGRDQFISAAGTNWAVMALAPAVRSSNEKSR